MARRLVVTADDAGLHPAITEAVIKAHVDGIVTATSVAANCEAFRDTAAELRLHPQLDCGVHLTLVEERPILAPAAVPSLVAADGRFHRDYRHFVRRYAFGRVSLAEVEREWRAQLDVFVASGLRPTHLNSHQHLHMLPALFRLAVQLATEYDIPYVRTVDDRGGRGSVARRLSVAALSLLGRRARRHLGSRLTSSTTIGVADAGHVDRKRLVALLPFSSELTELVMHPGVDDSALRSRYAWNYEWESEFEALVSRDVAQRIRDLQLETLRPARAR